MLRLGLILSLFATAPAAFAAEAANTAAAEEEDDLAFLKEGEEAAKQKAAEQKAVSSDSFSIYDGADEEFADFTVAPKPKPAPKAPQVEPLSAVSPAQVVFSNADSIVVELPVLLARTPADVDGDFWLVGEVFVEGKKVAETRQFVSASGLAQLGPTTAFLKLQAPVSAPVGQVEMKVSQVTSAGTKPLFTQQVKYRL